MTHIGKILLRILIVPTLLCINCISPVMAANLMQVYQQALVDDPIYLQAAQTASRAKSIGKPAEAVFNLAAEDLILRVAQAYFNILKDEDNLAYNKINKENLATQLAQTIEERKAGEKTQTDVYTVKAYYETAIASTFAAETMLADDQENLCAITGNLYLNLAKLSEKFPLTNPKPENIAIWIKIAQKQNWSIKAACCANEPALQVEQIIRSTTNTTHHSYLAILTDVKKVQADKQAIKSAIYSLRGLKEEYRAGSRTLLEVLEQQQKVLQAQMQYSADRYAYINDFLTLKKAVGTLNSQDLAAINAWLIAPSTDSHFNQTTPS